MGMSEGGGRGGEGIYNVRVQLELQLYSPSPLTGTVEISTVLITGAAFSIFSKKVRICRICALYWTDQRVLVEEEMQK
jgi:hypothetical protein